MPKYRGNVGNLLQHWVLCEILNASRDHAEHVTFIDAYSMSPFATERPRIDDTAVQFDCVRKRLPGEHSPYEETWHKLLSSIHTGSGYPNSAAFLTAFWPAAFSLLLCEADPATVQELEQWVDLLGFSPECVFAGDWRRRFQEPLPAAGDLIMLSFDPYMLSRSTVRHPDSANMYPSDLDLIATAVAPIPKGIIIQLSTYSVNNANSQDSVISEVRSRFKGSGLELVTAVRTLQTNGRDPNRQMMSLVLAKGVKWADSLASLENRFQSWQVRACAG
jgi:hypothetical protein